ncbi:hypothetical protein D3C72_1589150 [compost metagenome]
MLHGVLGHILHGLLRDVLKLLGQGAPPLQGICACATRSIGSSARAILFGGCIGGRACSRRRLCNGWRSLLCGRSLWCGALLPGRHSLCARAVGELLPVLHHRSGPVLHRNVHRLECRKRHLLHFHGLDGGSQGTLVLLQPEQHGFELANALFQVVHAHGRGNPVTPLGKCRGTACHSALGQFLQKIKAGCKRIE